MASKTVKDALDLVPELEEMGVTVAIIDGLLGPNEKGEVEGLIVAKAIRDKAPSIKIIANPSFVTSSLVMGGFNPDKVVLKSEGSSTLVKAVTEI